MVQVNIKKEISNSDKFVYAVSPSNCISISEKEAENVEIHNAYLYFVNAYDNIDVSKLSDKDLQRFRDLCKNSVLEAGRELMKRRGSKDITDDILQRAGFKKTGNCLFVLRLDDNAIELLNLHFDAEECKRHWMCYTNTDNDYSITRTSIQTVEHFNKLMELMDIDFKLKEE